MRQARPHRLAVWAALAVLLAPNPGIAAPGAFTREDTFAASVPTGLARVDFEAFGAGTELSGALLTAAGASAGISLPAGLPDVLDPARPRLELVVVEDPVDSPASSGRRSLGLEDPGNFDAIPSGEPLTFRLSAATTAFGLTVITPEEPGGALFDGDLELRVAGEKTARLALADGPTLGTFGGREYRAYFLGIVGRSAFSTVQLITGPSAAPSTFLFNLDDLVVPLPEPRSTLTALTGSVLLAVLGRGRVRRQEVQFR